MGGLQVRNEVRGSVLAERVTEAFSLPARLRGWIGQEPPMLGEGLWIRPCNSIHTCFLRFPLDALFLDAALVVVGMREEMSPWRFSRIHWRAKSVLELPAGVIAASGTCLGDRLRFQAVQSPSLQRSPAATLAPGATTAPRTSPST